MNVLITGGSGFIGSHLADRLLSKGHKVLVIDNYATGRRDNLAPKDGLTIEEGTIVDKALVDRLFDAFKPDVVVHAAASYKDPDDWEEDVATNGVGTVNCIRAAERNGVKRFIYFQTALCYGLKPLEQPITLSHPIRPEGSSYAYSKTLSEQYLAMSSLDWISFRLANAYGPRNISGPLPTFYQRLSQGKGCFITDTRRDFVYVQDLVDVVVKAVEGKGRKGPYHISSGSDYSIEELFAGTLAALDLPADTAVDRRPRMEDDVATILIDPAETNKDFDWKTTTGLTDGIKATIAYYKEFGINQTFTHLKVGQEKH
jgi:UDP-glucose 4-epimerase